MPRSKPSLEVRPDPAREDLQRNLMEQYARRQNPSEWASLPNGRAVRAVGLLGMKYPGEKAADMLARPEGMLKDPKPPFSCGPRYQWRVRISTAPMDNRPSETQALHRAERIRYVEVSEIDPNCEFAVYTPLDTANNCYVTYQSMILCEILDANYCYQTYQGWEDWALSKVLNIEDTTRAERGTTIEGKTDISVDQKDVRVGG